MGTKEAQDIVKSMIDELFCDTSSNGSFTNDNNYGNKRNVDRFDKNDSRRDFQRSSNNEQEEKCTFFVESSKVGKIIGKRGSKIRELQDQSGAKLDVSEQSLKLISIVMLQNIISYIFLFI